MFDKTVPPMKEGGEKRMRKSIAAAAGNWSGKSIQSWTDRVRRHSALARAMTELSVRMSSSGAEEAEEVLCIAAARIDARAGATRWS